jgi:hypothetical protein
MTTVDSAAAAEPATDEQKQRFAAAKAKKDALEDEVTVQVRRASARRPACPVGGEGSGPLS